MMDGNACGAPALLAGLFGFLRAKPKEIWSYGFLMWAPQAIRFGIDWAIDPAGWFVSFRWHGPSRALGINRN